MKRLLLALLLPLCLILFSTAPSFGAAVTHFECEQVTAQTHTGDTNFSTEATCSSSNFVANKTYILFASAQFGGSNANNEQDLFEVRLAHGAGPTAFTDSLYSFEPVVTGEEAGWFYFAKYTVPATPVDVVVQARVSDATTTVTVDTMIVNGICLDCELTTNDWKFAEDTVDQELTPGTKSGASITWTPSATGDWLVMANCSVLSTALVENNTTCLINGGAETVPRSEVETEGTAPAQTMTWTLGRVYNLAGSTEHTFTVQAAAEFDQTPDDTLLSTRIFALRLGAFQQGSFEYQAGPITLTGGSFVEVGNVDPTPNATGDWLLLGFGIMPDNATGFTNAFGQFTVGGTVTPVGVDDKQVTIGWDGGATELLPIAMQSMVNLGASLQDLDFDWRAEQTDDTATHVTFLALSMELAASSAIPRPDGGAASSGFWSPPYKIEPLSLPDGEEQVVYDDQPLTAVSGKTPITWAISSGSLPSGLTLSSAGVISGTPGVGSAGTYNFTVRTTTAIGGNAYRALTLVVQTPPDPPANEPWELTELLDAAALEEHYTAPSAAGLADGSSCTNAESISTAVGHVDAGDHHILCAGTYSAVSITRACTEANPCVWRADVDANGDPADAYLDGVNSLDAKWHSFRGVRFGDTDGTSSAAAVRMREQGTSLINIHVSGHRAGSGVDSFPFGANMILYGVTLRDNGLCNHTPPSHNIYTQNKGQLHGTKYYIQMISLDGDCPSPDLDRWSFHAYNESTGDDSRTNRIHLQDSVFQDSSFVLGTNAAGHPDELNTIKNDWFFNLNEGTFWRVGYQNPFQGRVTNNLWYGSQIDFRYWGAGGTGYTPSDITQFENNTLIQPFSNRFVQTFWTRTYTSTTSLGSTGAPKIRDNTVWDNNTYRINGATERFAANCNGTNSGDTLTFAQWKAATSDCRETPGTSFDVNSTLLTTLPTVDQVECFDNFYQSGWGYCRAVDWDGNASITLPAAEVQKVIGSGKAWKIRNARDFHGTPLETGTCGTPCGDITVTPLPTLTDGVLIVWITSQP